MASLQIGELSNPINSYSPGIDFLFLTRIFKNMLAYVSLLKNIPFFCPVYFFSISV